MPASPPATKRRLTTRLRSLEQLLAAAGYEVRYERGHFRAGACLVHERRVVVVNRYFDAEARIRALESIVPTLELTSEDFDDEAHRTLLAKLVG